MQFRQGAGTSGVDNCVTSAWVAICPNDSGKWAAIFRNNGYLHGRPFLRLCLRQCYTEEIRSAAIWCIQACTWLAAFIGIVCACVAKYSCQHLQDIGKFHSSACFIAEIPSAVNLVHMYCTILATPACTCVWVYVFNWIFEIVPTQPVGHCSLWLAARLQ